MPSLLTKANNLAGTAGTTAAQDQASAAGTYGTLNPFLTSELTNPQGYTQGQQTSMLSAGQAGAGGATSGITGQANLTAARTRNSGGFGSALDAAARSRQQASAGASEQIAGNNADLQQKQQQEAASGLQGLYGTNSKDALDALGLQGQALSTGVQAADEASKNSWFSKATSLIGALNGRG
jgi:hypothetical protein